MTLGGKRRVKRIRIGKSRNSGVIADKGVFAPFVFHSPLDTWGDAKKKKAKKNRTSTIHRSSPPHSLKKKKKKNRRIAAVVVFFQGLRKCGSIRSG